MEQGKELGVLIADALKHLERHGSSKTSIQSHRETYKGLELFCNMNNIHLYTEAVGELFIEGKISQTKQLCESRIRHFTSAIRRLNCVVEGVDWVPIHGSKKKSLELSCYDNILVDYEKYLHRTDKTEKCIRVIIVITARFLRFIEDCGCVQLGDLTPKHLYAGFNNANDAAKHTFRVYVNAFLRYAHIYGLVEHDYSGILPSVVRRKTVPTVYSPEEIEQLLASIDRSTPSGKRSYAVVLIAARLGLRASDIAALTPENFNLTKETIEIIQQKTKTPLTLPLLNEVKAAVSDYIDNARPRSDDKQIFLSLHGNSCASGSTVSAIVQYAFKRSGIDCKNRKSGSHALRSSLASALLAEGNDYFTVQKALGHLELQSTKNYAKAEVEQLRINALSVPTPTGMFETLLADGGIAI